MTDIRLITRRRLERFHLGGWIVGGLLLSAIVYVQAGAKAVAGVALTTCGICYALYEKHQQNWKLWDSGNYLELLRAEERQHYLPLKPEQSVSTAIKTPEIDWDTVVHTTSDDPASPPVQVLPNLWSAVSPPAASNWQPEPVQTVDLAASLAEKLQSTMIVGQPGAGKGVLVSAAICEIKQRQPGVTIWVVDPKCDPHERHYWQSVDKYLGVPIRPFTDSHEIAQHCETITLFVTQFQQITGPKLLIVDEALCLKEKSGKWYSNFLIPGFNALCSLGRSSRQYGWILSQSPNASDIGTSGGVRNVYRRVLVMHESNTGLLDNGSTFFSGKPDAKLFAATGRVFYDSVSNQWHALPIYRAAVNRHLQSFYEWLKPLAGSTITLQDIALGWGSRQVPPKTGLDWVLPVVETAIADRVLEESTPEAMRSQIQSRSFIVAAR